MNETTKRLVSNEANQLHQKLFPEEYGKHNSSVSEYRVQPKAFNHMYSDYLRKVNLRRGKLDISHLSISGMPIDDSSMELCIAEENARIKNQSTKYTQIIIELLHEIKEVDEAQKRQIDYNISYVNGIDINDPNSWSEVMINNLYSLEVASDMWELETPISFSKFRELIFTDVEFQRNHIPRVGMDSQDYNPWRIKPK